MTKLYKKITLLSQSGGDKDFPRRAFKLLLKIEQKHFWFAGRNKIIGSILNKNYKNKNITFLEIGCGTGYVLSYIEKLGFKTTGLDIHREALEYARTRTNSPLIAADILKDQISTKFDAIGLFDVLEHIEDQTLFLKRVRKLLKKNGKLFITVPADRKLWSFADEISGHKRRYSTNELKKILTTAHFKIQEVKYFGFFLYFPQLIFRKLTKKVAKRDFTSAFTSTFNTPIYPINRMFEIINLIENKLFYLVSFPFGSSLIAVVQNDK